MEMSYGTIPVFGIQISIFREQNMAYMVTNAERPHNHPIYSLDTEMGSDILFIEGDEDSSYFQNDASVPTEEELEGVWEVSFDGSASKQGVGA